MEVSDLKDLFFILGVLVSIVFVLGIVMISVIKLHDFIAECIYAKRYEYMIKHRFDDPPLAKCYCIDCKYCYGEPTKTGGNVYCSLWNSGIIIQDNSFQKAASKTTPLVEKEGKTVTDYEYLFSMNLQAKLKEKIQGAIYVKVNENDSLVIKVTRRDGNNFDVSFTDFANRMLNGLTTDYAAYEVVQKYKKFVMTQFFK